MHDKSKISMHHVFDARCYPCHSSGILAYLKRWLVCVGFSHVVDNRALFALSNLLQQGRRISRSLIYTL